MRDHKISEYNKTIGIKERRLTDIDKIRGKKSKAGKLDEIINYYFEQNGLSQMRIEDEKEKDSQERATKAANEVELNICLSEANDAYWSYVKLNGTAVEGQEGVYNASAYTWDEAQRRKDKAESVCFKKYGK